MVICGLYGSTIFFPHYLINGTIFGKMLLNIKRVFRFSLQLLSDTFLILRRIQWNIIINVYMSSCKLAVILAKCEWNSNFLDIFSKNTRASNFMKIRSEQSCSMRTDGRTGGRTDRQRHRQKHMTKLTIAFRILRTRLTYPLKNFPASLCPPLTPYGMAWDWTHASAWEAGD
jgi:hypothetical protein